MDKNTLKEQIFTAIDSLGKTLENTPDLSQDVMPFLASTLTKVKQLSLACEKIEIQYELMQIATNYLPRAIDSYCTLPLEYRNKKIIKNNCTARQLLVEDLKIFKKQVLELENQAYETIEKELEINSNVIRQKYDQKFKLAEQVESQEDFVNQFDYDKYSTLPSYKEIFLKNTRPKNKSEQPVVSTRSLMVFSLFKTLFSITCVVCIIGLFGWGLYALSLTQRPLNYERSVTKGLRTSYDALSLSLLPNSELMSFRIAKNKEMVDNSSYVAERLKVSSDNQNNLHFMMSDIKKDYCDSLVDLKNIDFPEAEMIINGIAITNNPDFIDHNINTTSLHSACHLEEGNKVDVQMNNAKLYQATEAEKAKSKYDLQLEVNQLKVIVQNKTSLRNTYSYKAEPYSFLNHVIEKLNDKISTLNGFILQKQ